MSSNESSSQISAPVSFKVDDFTGAAHVSFPIAVPPARGGLAPQLSLNYSSSGGNGWLGVGWDLSVGFIQRRGPRKGVPKYNDTQDVFELQLGGAPQELVPIGGGEYRLKIEGAYLKIRYYSAGNYWEVLDKSGTKMRFGATQDSKIGTVTNPSVSTNTYRWCLDRVDDLKTNYMEIIYFRDEDQGKIIQIYLQEIRYNGQVWGNLPHNHNIYFNRELSDRPDPVYNYRGGFKMLTRKRLSSIEVKTGGDLVRRYQLNYPPTNPNARSVLSSITLYGNDGTTTLPPTTFTYQTHTPGVQPATAWPNPSWWEGGGYYIQETLVGTSGTSVDVMDINGDGLMERVALDRTEPYDTWDVYTNNGAGFDTPPLPWSNPSGPVDFVIATGNNIRVNNPWHGTEADVIDLDGDGLPDRVKRDFSFPVTEWDVYFNYGGGFQQAALWPNPSTNLYNPNGDLISANFIRNIDGYGNVWTDVIDMNGDGLPDRIVWDNNYVWNPSDPQPSYWKVFLNNGSGFESTWIEWYNPSPSATVNGNYIRSYDPNGWGCLADLIDMNGDGLPDLVVKTIDNPWKIYFNNGRGFDPEVTWVDPDNFAGYIHSTVPDSDWSGTFSSLMDLNGDGLPDRVIYNFQEGWNPWRVYLNNGNGFGTTRILWTNATAWIRWWEWSTVRSNVFDIDGDGLADWVVSDYGNAWNVYSNNGPVADLLSGVNNGIGGTITVEYWPSTVYDNTGGDGKSDLPFIVQTVSRYTQTDGRNHTYTTEYDYEGGYYDPSEVEFRGFKKVTACQPNCEEAQFESKTETWFHQQDYFLKGRIETQILASKEGHTRQVVNVWNRDLYPTGHSGKFPALEQTASTITDAGASPYSHSTSYIYDSCFNVLQEHKYGPTIDETIRTYFTYTSADQACAGNWILSKPTWIGVYDHSYLLKSAKWMDYDCNTGNLTTEEVCKSDTPNTGCGTRNGNQNSIINYGYNGYKNLETIIDPRSSQTTLAYDSTQTHIYTTTNALVHVTTTEYDPAMGNLKKLIPPHLQGTVYSITYTYDPFGRKQQENRPDGGFTYFNYVLNDPVNLNYVWRQEHIANGPSLIEHYSVTHFDGLGRVYWAWNSSGTINEPLSKLIITRTEYDSMGRVHYKSNPFYWENGVMDPIYDTFFTYDGLSRVTRVDIPDSPSNRSITTFYQGLKKTVVNPRGFPTDYTYDVYQRLKKVQDPFGTITEYKYDTLGNLIEVKAAVGAPEQNITTMTYDSQSKKRTMNDPDMGSWTYAYDKSGNLELQTDSNGQKIRFIYDGLNRVTEKRYGDPAPVSTVYYTYDDPSVPYSKGKLTKVSFQPTGEELREDRILEYDLLQRVVKSQKTTGMTTVSFGNTYDSAGRVITLKYFPGLPNEKIYSYEYDVAGNLLYLRDNVTGYVVQYFNFTALGQPGLVHYSNSVKTSYTYYAQTGRLWTLNTWKQPPIPIISYQNLTYTYDEKGNIGTIADTQNSITHTCTYDYLDRLSTTSGTGSNPYYHEYQYDRIGNITFKSDVGAYTYDYSNKPHAVKSVLATSAIYAEPMINIIYNYDQKPERIQRNFVDYIRFTYDGNGQRVKKYNHSTGQTTLYFGEGYEIRDGIEILHLFAGNRRIASIRTTDRMDQFYHPNHLGSASVITDSNGNRKEQIEYFPFGTERAVGSQQGTYDFDAGFPDVFYSFTDQEVDDDIGFYNYGARLYDPILGRFISPDRLVQAPENPQSLNRYSYCLNNPLIYTDPSGEFWVEFFIIASIVVSAAYGAATAHSHGMAVWEGAFIGAVTAGLAAGIGYAGGVMASAWATNALTWVMDTASVAYGSAVRVVGTMAGGFVGGATSGALNAGVYGGNICQSALYGGLIGAAFAGTIQGAVELNNWANPNKPIMLKDPKTGQYKSAEAVVLKETEKILGITDQIKQTAEGHFQIKNYIKMFPAEDPGGAMAQQIGDICGAGIGCHRTFDLKATAWKFDTATLHIRSFGDTLVYHWDRFNLTVSFGNFVKHFGIDMIRNTYYAIKDLGFWPGLAEGL
jgi:RHS repeat-associated protein